MADSQTMRISIAPVCQAGDEPAEVALPAAPST
jgi:hypothetical protein